MRPHGVVVAPLMFDDNSSFSNRVEDLTVEKFVAQSSVETFYVAVFPG
jgi:hypothetical protein